MTYTEFADKMLIALYQESATDDSKNLRFQDLVSKYGLNGSAKWVERLANEWEQSGLAEVRSFIGSPLEWGAEITAYGMRQVEEGYGDKEGVGTILEPINSELALDDGLLLDGGLATLTIDSSQWTGIETRLRQQPELVEAIREKLHEIDKLVDQAGLTNLERQKAKAISEALIKLVESPEPEWKAIVELLTSKPLTALLNVASIVQIVLKLFFGI